MTRWFAILLFGLASSLVPAAPLSPRNATMAERGPAAWLSIVSTPPWAAPAMGELELPTAIVVRRCHVVPNTEICNRVFTRPAPRDLAPPLSPSVQSCRASALLCRPHASVSACYPVRILDGSVATLAPLPHEPPWLETDPIC
jgi:hypothetical protein